MAFDLCSPCRHAGCYALLPIWAESGVASSMTHPKPTYPFRDRSPSSRWRETGCSVQQRNGKAKDKLMDNTRYRSPLSYMSAKPLGTATPPPVLHPAVIFSLAYIWKHVGKLTMADPASFGPRKRTFNCRSCYMLVVLPPEIWGFHGEVDSSFPDVSTR